MFRSVLLFLLLFFSAGEMNNFSAAEPTGPLVFFQAPSTQTLPDSLKSYLIEAIQIVKNNALHRDSINWFKTEEQIFTMAAAARTYEDCYPALRFLLQALGDRHSFLISASISKAVANPDAYKTMPLTTGEILEGKIAYLRMPFVFGGNESAATYFADQLHLLLKQLDHAKPKAWILDLRSNRGGNCWPMLAGIGPLLGEGVCGYFVDPYKKEPPLAWSYENGQALEGSSISTKVSGTPYQLRQSMPWVAVLTGPNTASSGEVVTVAFRKRPKTRSFGEATAGLSTGNQEFRLRDGAMLILTTSIYADREREVYGGKIHPDEVIGAGLNSGKVDLVIESAKQWLGTQIKK